MLTEVLVNVHNYLTHTDLAQRCRIASTSFLGGDESFFHNT